ncbi:MAG: hypothetical protein PHO28_02635 [Candidatus Pacebacteria bacterium]|nr:hypothetical protein [Candidatus Paceibacterota bacterium]
MEVNWSVSPHQKYIDDKKFIEIAIEIELIYKTLIDNFFFHYKYHNREIVVSWNQTGGLVQLLIEDLQIPKSLLEDLKINKGSQYIISIINQVLPLVNNELDHQKYSKGNILIKRINFLDITKICLIYHEENKNWQNIIIPLIIFPKECSNLQRKYFQDKLPPIYIRDYIDAMESFIKYNFNDCIRQIITSLEDCFCFYKLKVRKWPLFIDLLINYRGRVPKIIRKYIKHSTIKNNLLFLYTLRNKIVHEGFIIKPEHGWICKKGIGTMSYVFQHPFINEIEKEYLLLLVNQFLLIINEINGLDLEDIKKWHQYFNELSEVEKDKFVIKSSEDLDKFMFSGLEITKKEKREILKSQ